jgi:hypothetical protein
MAPSVIPKLPLKILKLLSFRTQFNILPFKEHSMQHFYWCITHSLSMFSVFSTRKIFFFSTDVDVFGEQLEEMAVTKKMCRKLIWQLCLKSSFLDSSKVAKPNICKTVKCDFDNPSSPALNCLKLVAKYNFHHF